MKYTVQATRMLSKLPTQGDAGIEVVLVSNDVGGIYAYILDDKKAEEILGKLVEVDPQGDEPMHYTLDFDANDHAEDFHSSLLNGNLDVLFEDGEAIGYTIRRNEATYRLLNIINGCEVEPFPAGWLEMSDEERRKAVGVVSFGTGRGPDIQRTTHVESQTADQIIHEITDVLIGASPEFIAEVANKVLGSKAVKYIGTVDDADTFEVGVKDD
jgi:hypothetical protein